MGLMQLPELIAALPPERRSILRRLYHISPTFGEISPDPHLFSKLEQLYGSVEAGLKQPVIKITNRVTLDSILFNPLRASRPLQTMEKGDLEEMIERGRESDQFARPYENTVTDVFGRLESEHALTAANISKVDGWSGVVIFREFHPHRFTCEQVVDYLGLARRWAGKVLEIDRHAPYFFFLWNCLWKAGGSQIHGHAQVMMTRDMHYGAVERLRREALSFKAEYGLNFFEELVEAGHLLSLTSQPAEGVTALVSLTPIRDREIWLVSDSYSPQLAEAIYKTLSFYFQQGITSFNVAIQMPPLLPVSENWEGFPVIARLVNRGNPLNRQSDAGGIELFGATVVVTDPLNFASDFRHWLEQN
jgi:galactose-1-phosphate uridylyltransferase